MQDWQIYLKKRCMNIKMDLKETGYGDNDWIQLA
jgi:hypothetical protein